MKLEELLSKLIKRGWKPFGFEAKEYKISIFNIRSITLQLYHTKHPTQEWIGYSIRNITSKESGLWQFVCENRMIKAIGSEIEIKNLNEGYGVVRDTDYQYRLIVSVLKYEDELEDFLIQNIKVGNED